MIPAIRPFKILSILALASIILAACASPTAAPVPTQPATTNPPVAVTLPPAPALNQPPANIVAPTAAQATVAPTGQAGPTATPFVEPTLSGDPNTILMATTTSTRDTGLLDTLLPMYQKQFNVKVNYVAVGSGQALQIGRDGNADVLLVHDPANAQKFMDNQDGVRMEDVMFNDFVIIGPAADPAKISGMTSAAGAFKAIAAAQATFISRGDNSGTNTKELALWKAAGITPEGDWYVKAGQGMGAVLTMSDEKNAYTLSDRATYLTQSQKGLTLKILVQGDKSLLNPYNVIAVNPDKSPMIKNILVNQFIDWLISAPVQQIISDYKKADFGKPIFFPNSRPWYAAHPDLQATGTAVAPKPAATSMP